MDGGKLAFGLSVLFIVFVALVSIPVATTLLFIFGGYFWPFAITLGIISPVLVYLGNN